MKLFLSFILLFLCDSVVGFTRLYRKFDFPLLRFNGQNLQLALDPAILDFRRSLDALCHKLSCSDPEAVLNMIGKAYDDHITDSIFGLTAALLSNGRDDWFQLSNEDTVRHFRKMQEAVRRYKQRWNKTKSLRVYSSAVELSEDFGYFISDDPSTPLDILEVASLFFHKEFYELAMTLCYDYLEPLLAGNSFEIDLAGVMAGLNLMAEGHRLRGHLALSTMYYAKVCS